MQHGDALPKKLGRWFFEALFFNFFRLWCQYTAFGIEYNVNKSIGEQVSTMGQTP